ncbi:MAG: hypothetical protein LBR12_01515 [Opitutaceae bacterium]|nr:hypothetical protein [Opitutaceae bacterium]
MNRHDSGPSVVWRVFAAPLAALLLAVSTAAAAPGAHQFFHADAAEPGHVCAVTLFAHGVEEAVPPALEIAVPVAVETPRQLVGGDAVFAAPERRLPPGRAPPAC